MKYYANEFARVKSPFFKKSIRLTALVAIPEYLPVLIDAAEKKLANKVHNPLQPVTISDHIVTDRGYKGEFYTQYTERESEDNLISRMINEIEYHADGVKNFHIRDNMEPKKQDTLRANHYNNITRLCFNEFYFYPAESQGPLSEEDFARLLEKVRTFAQTLPDNLHLLLASFPVQNEESEVHNLSVYVQCGNHLQLDIRAKAMPHEDDPTYPGTTNAGFYTGRAYSAPRHLLNKLNDLLSNPDLDDIDALQFFIKTGLTHKHYPPPQELPELLKNQIALLEKKCCSKANGQKIRACLNVFKEQLKASKKPKKMHDNLPSPTLSDCKKQQAYIYNRFILGITKDKIEFPIYLGICRDHAKGFEMAAFQFDRSYHNFPFFASQVVTSSSVHIEKKNAIVRHIIHADSHKGNYGILDTKSMQRLQPVHQKKATKYSFGEKYAHITLRKLTLDSFSEEETDVIKRYNHFHYRLEAYRQVAVQNPQQQDALLELLIDEIAKEACAVFYEYYEINPAYLQNTSVEASIISLLKGKKINNKDALNLACINGKFVTELIEECSLNIPHYAAYYSAALLEQLLDKGMDPNTKNNDEQTLLEFALDANNLAAVTTLLQHKDINVNLFFSNGKTALMQAAAWGMNEIVQLLLKHPFIKPNYCDDDNNTALLYAINKCTLSTLKLLLEDTRTNIHCRNRFGTSALHVAVKKGLHQAVQSLLDAGANTFLENHANETALDFAIESKDRELIVLLSQKPTITFS